MTTMKKKFLAEAALVLLVGAGLAMSSGVAGAATLTSVGQHSVPVGDASAPVGDASAPVGDSSAPVDG